MTAEQNANVVRMPTNDPVAIGAALATDNGGPGDGLSTDEHLAQLIADDAAMASRRAATGGTSEESIRASWRPVDLTDVLAGKYERQQPTVLRRADGVDLAYAGRVHWISGEPESQKTWLALLACLQQIVAGRAVVYIDYEDDHAGIVGRLLGMGADPEQIRELFTYLSPEEPLNTATKTYLAPLFDGAALVVIDACTESLAIEGLSSGSDTDVATWLNRLPRWAAHRGPAVFVIDHVVKAVESRGRWATGSGHKLAGLDGAAYTLETVKVGGQGMEGKSRLYVSKDRRGAVRPCSLASAGGKQWLGDLVVDSTGPFTDVGLREPKRTASAERVPFRPTAVMAKVSNALEVAGKPLNKGIIESRVGGKASVVRTAIDELELDDHIRIDKGPSNGLVLTLLKPFVEQGGPT